MHRASGMIIVTCIYLFIFLDPLPKKKKRSDHKPQKTGFRFDLKNPLEVWILWIYDRFF